MQQLQLPVQRIKYISSVIRQKGESKNGGSKKTKYAKFSEKRTFLTSWNAHVMRVSGGKKCSFFGKFFCFEVRPFALLPTR